MTERFAWPVRPQADPQNMVVGKNYRFTVLTDCLIRMEYAQDGAFEDRASQRIFYRDLPRCEFACERAQGMLMLETASLKLCYREELPFAEDTLSITLKIEPASTWHFGEDFEDLGGTVKTLDQVEGACQVGRGVISRNGFSVLDDSDSVVLESDGWVGVRAKGTSDLYFFGYGLQYLRALQDFYRLTGEPPMLPAYALGNWWSRYYAYTQQEYCDLVERFRREDVPFSVGVVDMDWHVVQIPEDMRDQDPSVDSCWNMHDGWTGYSWNRELFPDPQAFLRFLKERHLHTSLNLHPHAGVRRHEDMYEEMARACGIDPADGRRVPLDLLSKEFMANYFDIIHHPYEKDGVDFWWMDWQQGRDYWWIHEPNRPGQYQDERERMDPLWMLNHLHILDISRNGKRPMFFSRYAGPGSHRYPVGFSGDTFVSWRSLDFQPWFTATASNIGYSWWSHDIGGHMGGCRDDELVVRWVQFGVLSPINRLHSSNDDFQSKEPWCYGYEEQAVLKDWLRLRHALFPYLYTMNYRSHTQGIPLMLPMYYSHPKCLAAYQVSNQYWFGSELMVAPITQKRDASSRLGKVTAWLPQGDWFDFFNGLHYVSARGRKMDLHRDLRSVPVLAKAGAIVPMANYAPHDNRLLNAETMTVMVFPGADNGFTLYEDAGDYSDYRNGACARTEMKLQWAQEAVFTIDPAQGDLSLIPGSRRWRIQLRGFHRDVQVNVSVGGVPVTAVETAGAGAEMTGAGMAGAEVHERTAVKVTRDPASNSTVVEISASVTQQVQVRITGSQLIHDNSDVTDRCRDILLNSQILFSDKLFMMSQLQTESTIHEKMVNMMWRGAAIEGVMDAVQELLTLTEEYRTR